MAVAPQIAIAKISADLYLGDHHMYICKYEILAFFFCYLAVAEVRQIAKKANFLVI